MASAPPLHVSLPPESFPEFARTHRPVRQEEAKAVIEASGLPRQEGARVAIGMQKPIRRQLG